MKSFPLLRLLLIAAATTAMTTTVAYAQTTTPAAQQIIDNARAACAGVTPSVLAELCVSVVYESPTTLVLNGDMLIVQTGGYTQNPFFWQAVDGFKAQGYTIDSVLLSGQGSQGNPHEFSVVMSR
jgi:hypothetical protein